MFFTCNTQEMTGFISFFNLLYLQFSNLYTLCKCDIQEIRTTCNKMILYFFLSF